MSKYDGQWPQETLENLEKSWKINSLWENTWNPWKLQLSLEKKFQKIPVKKIKSKI